VLHPIELKIYHVVIISDFEEDHANLRTVVNKMFPLVIIDSVATFSEFTNRIDSGSFFPDLVFADNNLSDTLSDLTLLRYKKVILMGLESEEIVSQRLSLPACGYFKRTFGVNSSDWIARNLLQKFNIQHTELG
jgi:hypothetical protein